MYRRTAQIDRLGDLCCSHAYPPFLFHNRIQWVQRSDIYVSLEAYFPPPPPLYYIASLSLSLVATSHLAMQQCKERAC